MTVSVVQTKNAVGAGSPTTLNFTSAVTAGNSVVVWICDYNTSGAVISSTAPSYNGGPVTGATKLIEVQQAGTNVMYFAVWLLPDVASSGTSVAISTTNARADSNSHYYIAEVAGLGASPAADSASPNPATASSNGSANPSSGATGSAAGSSGIALGGMMQDTANSGWTGPAGWTTIAGTPNSYGGASYQVFTTSGGSYTWSTTLGSGQWSAGAVILDATAAPSNPSGTVQPPATVRLPRRYPSRARWAGTVTRTVNTVPTISGQVQPKPVIARRATARAVIRGTPLVTVNAAPPAGTGQQPHGFLSSRRPVGGIWGGAFTPQANASGPAGQVQPRATVPIPRRAASRGLWRGQSTPQPHVPGQVQPHLVIARRSYARGLWQGKAVPGIQPVPVTGGLVKRRTAARALWSGTIVRTMNALPVAVPAPKMRPRVVSRAAARAMWRGCPPQPFNAPVAVMISLGQPFTDWGTDLPFTRWGTSEPFTDWDTGLLYAR